MRKLTTSIVILFLAFFITTSLSAQPLRGKKKKQVPNGISEEKLENAEKVSGSSPFAMKAKKSKMPKTRGVVKPKKQKDPARPDALKGKQRRNAKMLKDRQGNK